MKKYLAYCSYLRSFNGNQAVIWYSKAMELLGTANTLHQSGRRGMEYCEQYYMLMAFVFENLLKGLILLRTNARIQHKGGYPGGMKGHDLIKLSLTAKVVWNPNEKRILKNLQGYAEWRGKYPVPLTDEGLRQLIIPYTKQNNDNIVRMKDELVATFKSECNAII